MSHNYFFDLQRHVHTRAQDECRRLLRQDLPDLDRRRSAGRLEALTAFEGFLARTLNPRLPKRLARQGSRDLGLGDDKAPQIK
jgi:hypothetical protein